MNEIFKQLLTGKDNQTLDIGRVTWFIGFIAIIGDTEGNAIGLHSFK